MIFIKNHCSQFFYGFLKNGLFGQGFEFSDVAFVAIKLVDVIKGFFFGNIQSDLQGFFAIVHHSAVEEIQSKPDVEGDPEIVFVTAVHRAVLFGADHCLFKAVGIASEHLLVEIGVLTARS